jgi:hypothetical protein
MKGAQEGEGMDVERQPSSSKSNTVSAFVGPWGGDGARAVDRGCTNESGAGAGQSGPLMISSTKRRGTEAGLSLNHKESRLPVSVEYIDLHRKDKTEVGGKGQHSCDIGRRRECVPLYVCRGQTEMKGV